jgi:hypothetical protein
MTHIKRLTLCFAAVCALGGLVASSASAALPEIGRCVKLEGVKEGHTTKYNGKYSNRKCSRTSSTETGKYEWLGGAPEGEKGFESPGTLEPATLETANGTQIACKNSKMFGEYTSPTTEKNEISLFECKLSTTGEPCQSARPEETPPTPQEGTIISLSTEGVLGYIKKSGLKPEIGWQYKPKTGSLMFVFECGATVLTGTTRVTIEGSFISQIRRPIDRMAEEFKLQTIGSEGKQSPEGFEGGEKAGLTATILNLTTLKSSTEAISYSAPAEEQSVEAEALEFKAIP